MRRYRLSENRLRGMIREAVKSTLNENGQLKSILRDRTSTLEHHMKELNVLIQEKKRELEELKKEYETVYNDYEQEFQNYNDRWGVYSEK